MIKELKIYLFICDECGAEIEHKITLADSGIAEFTLPQGWERIAEKDVLGVYTGYCSVICKECAENKHERE